MDVTSMPPGRLAAMGDWIRTKLNVPIKSRVGGAARGWGCGVLCACLGGEAEARRATAGGSCAAARPAAPPHPPLPARAAADGPADSGGGCGGEARRAQACQHAVWAVGAVGHRRPF